ncbi:uncharacterized protein LOC120531987 [Polypterus senegalus]|uniref:uncharacterized protein LOC120531987 n=1 Tax=Polypterus senegalus TaxID=55291 RepID=UPI001962502B|nr:uncharacterized protein LOC120531987 [Polypterus senegalus]
MQTLRKHKVDLIEWLSGDHQLVLQHVQCQALVTDREYRRLRSIQDPEGRVIELLDTLLSKGDAHCQQFIAILRGLQDTYPQLQAWFGQLGITGAPAALGCPPRAAPPDHEAKARQADAMVSDKKHFLRTQREVLIQGVKQVAQLADRLHVTLHPEALEEVLCEKTPQSQMRRLLDFVTSDVLATEVFRALCVVEANLMWEILQL